MDVNQIIENFLEDNPELWFMLDDTDNNRLSLELGLEDCLLAYGVDFTDIEVLISKDEIEIKVFGEQKPDYLSITKEVIKSA